MKVILGILLVASMSLVACGGAPTDGEGSATGGAASGQTAAPQTEGTKAEVKRAPETGFGQCTAAERDECISEDPGHFHASCVIGADGQPHCILL